MTTNTLNPRESSATQSRALILGIHLPSQSDEDVSRSLAELELLARTLSIDVARHEVQRRASSESALLVGAGKLRELARLTGGPGVARTADEAPEDDDLPDADGPAEAPTINLVLVDADLSPRQQRNLQTALAVEVMDRSAVILRIFESRAQTREARLEVEIARLRYEMPRLRELTAADDRHGGGGGAGGVGGRGGRGHTNLELARQQARDRIAQLRHELAAIQDTESARRSQRSDTFQVVLVGYTNAGKSTLMRALTGSDVLVEDKLFATLGTTVRRLQPETTPQILISDTVGFITNLPHELVASFRSTLEEARNAHLLLLVIDASDSQWRAQLSVTRETLDSIDATDAPRLLVLNKVDRLSPQVRQELRAELPDAIQLSAHQPTDVAQLREAIITAQDHAMCEQTLQIPYKMGQLLGEIRTNARVVAEKYDANGTVLRVRARPESIARWESLLR